MNYYEYVFFDEVIYLDELFKINFDRYDFFQKIVLLMLVNVFKYNFGGFVGILVFIW